MIRWFIWYIGMICSYNEGGGNETQFYYGQQMPLRILDETEFWKHQEEEHNAIMKKLPGSFARAVSLLRRP